MTGHSDKQIDKDKLLELIDSVISGSIQADEFHQLGRRLQSDPAARKLYLAELEIESLLQRDPSNLEPSLFPTINQLGSINRGSFGWLRLGLVMAAVLILGVGLFQLDFNNPKPSAPKQIAEQPEGWKVETPNREVETPPRQLRHQSVARITNSKNATWDSDHFLMTGSWLEPDIYRLATGDAEITFDAGAIVWIAAGSEFEIVNANGIRLIQGSLEADVPEQAIGFKVETPTGEITDLSTRFSVNVSDDGHADVHVLKGLVEARPTSVGESKVLTLKENTAMRMFVDAPPEKVEFSNADGFQFDNRNATKALNYLHFSFDQPGVANGIVPNDGLGGQGMGGAIVDGSADNSWLQVDGKIGKSLYFSGEGARITTSIKGVRSSRPRTIMFWVRINPETPLKNAYSFVAWGNPEKPNAAGQKWQIGWNPNKSDPNQGTLGAIRTEFGGGYVIGSTDLRDGRWHHVTSVYVGGTGRPDVAKSVRHYVDGKLESVTGWKSKRINTQPKRRAISLGDYIGQGSHFFETYKGWIDEFYLFDVALTPDQIVQIMEQNQPPIAADVVLPAMPARDAK